MPSAYLRHPAVRDDLLAFVAEDDVWVAPIGGGQARRITSGDGEAHHPSISPDGSLVAWTRRVGLKSEVWVAPVGGGQMRRVTWLGGIALVRGWTPEAGPPGGGRIVFATEADEPFRQIQALQTASAAGGAPTRMPWSRVRDHGAAPDGAVVLGRNTHDSATWKRDRTGTRGQLWLDRTGDGDFRRLLAKLDGNLTTPMLVGRRVWFLSDHEGVGNLYSCNRSGGGLTRHSHHDLFYARWAASDGRHVVYQHAGDVWMVDASAPDPTPAAVTLDVPVNGQRQRPRTLDAAQWLTEVSAGEGEEITIEARGNVFSLGAFDGGVERRTLAGARHRLARPIPGGGLLLVSDEPGEDRLQVHDAGEVRVVGSEVRGRPRGIAVSSAGLAAVSDHRGDLWVVDLETGVGRQVDHCEHGCIEDASWSPDGTWLAYVMPATGGYVRHLRLLDTRTDEVRDLWEPRFAEATPSFDPTGRYLYFLSARGFDAAVDVMGFDLHFPRPVQPYVVALREDVPHPWTPAAADASAEDPVGVEIDFDGLERRIVQVPVEPGRHWRVVGVEAGVLVAEDPIGGDSSFTLVSSEPDGKGTLRLVSLGDGSVRTLHEGVTEVDVAADRRAMIIRCGRAVRRVEIGGDASEDSGDRTPGRATGWIDLSRVPLVVDPASEWRQMFVESWRMMRDHFWRSDFGGVDWAGIREQYEPLLDRVTSRADLSDVLWDMHGELAVSHAYETGGDRDFAVGQDPAVGRLGIDVSWNGRRRGWVVDDVHVGDAWDPARSAAPVGPGRNVSPGEVIRAVDGKPTSADLPLSQMLVGRVGRDVELTVAAGSARRQVRVRGLDDDRPARYREWVERNRRLVTDATEGRVGYLHVPNMGAPGYGEFHRGWYSEFGREGLIVDVRFNEGGFVSTLVMEKLLRRQFGVARYRWHADEPYPRQAIAGPLVAMANEHTGSDGDLFSHAFLHHGLGPLVGTHTWGGVIGIHVKEPLVDRTVVTQPEFGHWFPDVGWEVEGTGVPPTHPVENRPQDDAAGVDRQLQTAIDLAMKHVSRHRPVTVTTEPLTRKRPAMRDT